VKKKITNQKVLQVTNVFLWSDSQIVLHWLHSTKQLKPYVASRIAEIKTLTSIENLKYCPTKDNPADLLTRGITTNQLNASEIWRTGPTWLLATPETTRPSQDQRNSQYFYHREMTSRSS
jgi:hypothetical protein